MPRILVVDPSLAACVRTEVALAGLGHLVSCVHTAQDAFERIRHAPPDLVIQEAELPDVDGLDLLGQIAALDADLPIVLHTDATDSLRNFRSWCADAHVAKSADPALLRDVVARLLLRRADPEPALVGAPALASHGEPAHELPRIDGRGRLAARRALRDVAPRRTGAA